MLKIKKTRKLCCQLGLIGLIGLCSLQTHAEEMGPYAPIKSEASSMQNQSKEQFRNTEKNGLQKGDKKSHQNQERKQMQNKHKNQSGTFVN